MKHLFLRLICASALLLSVSAPYAGLNGGFIDSAKVLSATPIYQTVRISRPVEECWNERVVYHEPARHSHAGTIAGGIIGGVIGNQLGHHGHHRQALTVAGTLIGAAIGSDSDVYRPASRYATRERRCELVEHYEEEERLVGYRVTYRFNGQTFVTRTREHPGQRIAVRIAVEPVEVD